MMIKMKNKSKKIIMLIITVIVTLTALLSSSNLNNGPVNAASELDPASKILCRFEDGETLVRFYSTDYFHYLFRSKSAMTNTQSVDRSWLNRILTVAGYDFAETNEQILGRPLRPRDAPEQTVEEANATAPKVSAFDRFGVAGLNWSSYQGEWKYYHINPCASQGRVSPTTFGTFYEGRLEPQSTQNEASTSIDRRSIQYNRNVISLLSTSFTDMISNAMFSLTKVIVALTILFVGLAFTDLTEMFGILGEDGSTAAGVFTSLFDGIFSGFVLIFIMITALYILYKGLIKRELRFALNTLIKTIVIFIVAVVMASNPSYWISVPNNITTYGQALIFNSMSSLYETDDGVSLCTTEVGSLDEGVDIDFSDPGSLQSELEQTNQNMRSMIACNMWQVLLLDPWARGQFGANFDELDNSNVDNNNESWVGTGSVPLGDGTTFDNWALFHLSTQTNAHAPVSQDSMPVLVNGVNADWWRIVDALSNYEEEVEVEVDETGVEHEFSVPIQSEPTEFWQSWVGNNRSERFGIAFISIAFGIVGSIAPLVFGFASAVFGLGITLFMMVSPVFFMFGLWGGRGEKIFLGWLSALVNTMIKKIIAGLLLILSLAFSLAIMDMVSEVGFITSFLLMIIVSTLLIKNKDKMFDMLADVDFGGAFDPRRKANQFMNTQKRTASEVTRTATAAIGGGISAKRTGQNVISGATTGVQRQLKNRLYTSQIGMNVVRQLDVTEGGEVVSNHTCVMCHKPLGVGDEVETAYRDDHGNYYCVQCADEMGLENLHEVIAGQNQGGKTNASIIANPNDIIRPEDERTLKATRGQSAMRHRDFKYITEFRKEGDKYKWEDENVGKAIEKNIEDVIEDFVVFKNIQMRYKGRVIPPAAPEPLHQYIDLALINLAWTNGRLDIIESTYKEAWKQWYSDNAVYVDGITNEHVRRLHKRVDDIEHDVSDEEVSDLLKRYFEEVLKNEDEIESKDIYVMRNGKLQLNNVDIDEPNED